MKSTLDIGIEKDKLRKLRNKHIGQRCFIVGNGPSIANTDLSKLKGEVTFALNNIVKIYSKTDWRPTYFCCINQIARLPYEHDFEKALWTSYNEGCTCIVNQNFKDNTKCKRFQKYQTCGVRVLNATVGGHLEKYQRVNYEHLFRYKSGESLPEVLNNHFSGKFKGAEIGVCEGRTTCHLIRECPDLSELYAIDPWKAYHDGVGDGGFTEERAEEAYSIAMQEINGLGEFGNKVNVIRKTSQEAAENFVGGVLDFVYIDACHTYKDARADFERWWPKVNSQGIFSGHDLQVPSVRCALLDFCEKMEIDRNRIYQLKNYAWYIKKEK